MTEASVAAAISPCNAYRYTLRRRIAPPFDNRREVPALFIMLNPSTADAVQDDPTIRRCIGFAKREGCTTLTVVNLFGLRATDPAALAGHPDPVGPENDTYLLNQFGLHVPAGLIVAAWGAHPFAKKRAAEVVTKFGFALQCLGKTKGGSPRHPLYVRGDQRLEPLV